MHGYLVSRILVENRKLLILVIHGKGVPLYTKKYILLSISLYAGQIWGSVDNKYQSF